MTSGRYIAIGAFVLAGLAGSYLLWRTQVVTPLVESFA